MNNNQTVVVIGAGQAGLQVTASLRQGGFQGRLFLIGDESNIPYQRPPLSKAYLKHEADETSIQLRPAEFFKENKINLICGETVEKVERSRKLVLTQSGKSFAYDKLVIATGTRPRSLNLKGASLEGVHTLRSFVHAANLRDDISQHKSIVIIGGGFIGLEVAACAAGMGKHVTVLEYSSRLMERAVSPVSSEFFRKYHQSIGVNVVTNARISMLTGSERVEQVVLEDGSSVPCDLVLVGIGALPNVELAVAAGLKCDNGILVDEFAVTSDPDIYSVGDCTNHPNAYANGRFRLESVQNAIDQAKTAAANILGQQIPYHAAPWFWSDQGEIKLQTVGLAIDTDQFVVRGDTDQRKFSVFHYRDGKLTAVESINSAGDHMVARKLISSGITPAPENVISSDVELKSLLSA